MDLTLPIVAGAAFVDSINPCAFAVLIILLSTVLSRTNKKEALLSGISFIVAVYISYFLMGLGILTAISISGVSSLIFNGVAVLAIIIGLLNIKDYFWYGKVFLMEVPVSWRPRLKKIIRSVTSVPGAFIVGFIVSLFLLPCTSGPYIVILGLLADKVTRFNGALWLLFYNAIFVFPMILINIFVSLGLAKVDSLESGRQKHLRLLHLIAGIIMVTLGILMLIL